MSIPQIPAKDLWKFRYLNRLNANCCDSGYSNMGRPLVKGEWKKKIWNIDNLDETVIQYCCEKNGHNTQKELGYLEERELCMNCASWLDKYHRELNTRTAENRGMDTIVPLLEQIIENQNRLQKGITDISEWLEVIARNKERQK